MPSSGPIARVGVALAALLVTACSVVAIGYHSAPTFVYWRLDQALDFDSEQGADVRARREVRHYVDEIAALVPQRAASR